jgi:hypothetical protein
VDSLTKHPVGRGKTGAMKLQEKTSQPIVQGRVTAELSEPWSNAPAHLARETSTKSVSLLLVEPDFRLRGAKGQIKVTFHGRVAEKDFAANCSRSGDS